MFTNTIGAIALRCAGAVAANMELWGACFFVLILDLMVAKELSSSSYIVRHIDSCPAVGYFFQRELAPNLLERGPCFLCFCRDNGTAHCWERDSRRCDVERYHHHRVGRQSRYRRSFSDVFFRDATRDFFGKTLPQQCKPFESSFSDGCPPVDWCIGCTICDCDSNGRWDCHILSFCDGKESKKKVNPLKTIREKKDNKSLDNDSTTEKKPTKRPPLRKTNKKTTKPKTTKPSKKIFAKIVKGKPKNISTNTDKNGKSAATKQKPPKIFTLNTQSKAVTQNYTKKKVKIIKKLLATRKPVRVNRNANKVMIRINANNNDTVKLGDKIKQILTQYKKMLARKIIEAKRTSVLNGSSCDGMNTGKDIETYNRRSKAIANYKNKYKRQSYQESNPRIRRAIVNQDREDDDHVPGTTDGKAVIPLSTESEKQISTTHSPVVSLISVIKPPQDNYYQYSVNNWTSNTGPEQNHSTAIPSVAASITMSTSSSTMNTTTINTTTNINITNESKDNQVKTKFLISVEPNNATETELNHNNTKGDDPEFNDIKFSKWYIIKVKNENKPKPVNRILLPRQFTTNSFNNGITTDIGTSKSREQNLKLNKFVNQQRKWPNQPSGVREKPCCKKNSKPSNHPDLTSLKTVLQNLYTELNKTAAAKRKVKPKAGVLNYVRKFFRKIFSSKKTRNHKNYGLGAKEDQTLHVVCENMGPCKINTNNRMILKYKLNQLNQETDTVLKSIRTVKGLLRLLDLPENISTSNLNSNNTFQNDIQKLGIVLNDYKGNEIEPLLTFDQLTQIEYLKQNTQVFIQSVKKFADILTEILAMVKTNMGVTTRKPPSNVRNYTTPLNKIKKLLYRYNIMQNSFMKKMFSLIKGEEIKVTTTEKSTTLKSCMNHSNENITDKYSNNIIETLRKLKNIAQILTPKRKKRGIAMKDDTLEYLLTLMEILIKKNQHFVAKPATDGIDLLIDAIKSAPEVKPIDQRYLNYVPYTSANKLSGIIRMNNRRPIDSSSDSKRVSNEDNPSDMDENMVIQDILATPSNTITTDDVTHQHTANLEIAETSSKPETLSIQAFDDEPTQKVYYRLFNQGVSNDYETTAEYEDIYKKRTNNDERPSFDKFESYVGDPKKPEGETAYVEDDAVGEVITKATIKLNNTNFTHRVRADKTIVITPKAVTRNLYVMSNNDSSSESQEINDKRNKLEWIEETFDREIRMINNESNFLPHITTSSTIKPKSTTIKIKDNNSDLTKEEDAHLGETTKESANTPKPSDVFYEKQIQFLTSLDYGPEKTPDVEVSESKDENRSNSDFPSYFV